MVKLRPRVLVVAEAANPEWVSVPLVGWSLVAALRKVADVHLVTQIRNRDAILRAGLIEGKDFTAIDSEIIARPLYRLSEALTRGKGGWTTKQAISLVSYLWFERLLWKEFGHRIQGGEFDMVHRVTPLSPTASSPIAGKCRKAGVPFVMGPLNGGVPWPKGFDKERRLEREWLSYVRGVYKILPGRNSTLAAASAIIVGSRYTEQEVPARYREKCIYIPENAIDPSRFSRKASPGSGGRSLRACFVGRIVPYKGADMVIEATAGLLRTGQITIDIVGDGPALKDLKMLAEREAVGAGVRFHGWLEHAQVQDVLSQCDLFVFPSIREFGGGAVLEAMAVGLPPLIVDYAGPAELVSSATGYKVSLGKRHEIVRELRDVLNELAKDSSSLGVKGAAARLCVAEHFTWEKKASQISQIYAWVQGERTDRPVFFP
ncbi:glycosyltransferase family 4 protein [Rhodobacter sp. CZR27]|uniref:glycosyltransferase family 4 protein n=1 Tax=Rhodobacter sp. CZR27 TaxID=2033869 RepID=UPI000BBE4BA9|nr:glycosyltransferase family 4 protein [Rhodobacter sp. CZR27]